MILFPPPSCSLAQLLTLVWQPRPAMPKEANSCQSPAWWLNGGIDYNDEGGDI